MQAVGYNDLYIQRKKSLKWHEKFMGGGGEVGVPLFHLGK